jgi:serine/threonine-protein kinase RsbW
MCYFSRIDLSQTRPAVTIDGQTIRLEIRSAFDMLEFVQVVTDHVGRMAGLGEEALHWVGMAVRESVINAIKHGNNGDSRKRVFVEFAAMPALAPTQLVVCVRDQGEGFDPQAVADCLAPENMLKTSGRGIFLMRSFMDEVTLARASSGGMEVRMVKRISR